MATSALPQPPYSAELLADLHAHNLPPEVERELWPLVRQDADALRILDALDQVSADLSALRHSEQIIHSVPDDVAARLEAALEHAPPPESGENAQVHSLAAERAKRAGRSRQPRGRWIAAAAAAVAVVAATGITATVMRGTGDNPGPDQPIAGPSTSAAVTSVAPPEPELTGPGLLTVIGRNDVTGPLADRAALTECLRAAGFNRTILGSRDGNYQGGPAVLALIAGPRPPGITAVFVVPDCSATNPKVLGHTDIN